MSNVGNENRETANQRALASALAAVRAHLARRIAQVRDDAALPPAVQRMVDNALATPSGESGEQPVPPSPPAAFETLCRLFHLSPFERDTLLLCAGMELDSSFAALCAAANGDPARPYPTFSLALATLPGAHWNALSLEGPLRRWRLIEFAGSGGLVSAPLTTRPLRIDERVLQYLTGVEQMDERLTGVVEAAPPAQPLIPSHLRSRRGAHRQGGQLLDGRAGPVCLAERARAAWRGDCVDGFVPGQEPQQEGGCAERVVRH